MADTDALLYLPGRDPAKLRVALRIPALSPGWQGSFHELLSGDRGRRRRRADAPAEPAWAGFRALRVTGDPRDATVSSIYLAAPDGAAAAGRRAGQYLTLRIAGAGEPAPVRSYSLSSAPDAGGYRISVKHEPHGVASTYLHRNCDAGAILDVAAPRGEFVLDDGTPGPAHLRRHRRDAGAGDAPRARRPRSDANLVDPRRPPAREHPLPPKPTPCSPRCRTPTSTSSTARPRPTNAAAPTPRPDVSTKDS